jgi:thioredoxin 1
MAAKNDSVIEVTNEEFSDVIKNGHKLVVVDFFAEWCMPCVMLAPVLDELAENDSMKEVKFAKLNIDDNQELANKYDVSSIPCLIIFKDGEEVDRIVGGQPGDVIESKIKKFLD